MHQPGLSAHHADISRLEPDRLGASAAVHRADPEPGRVAQRDRQHRPREIGLVPVLVQAQLRALAVEVHEAAIRHPLGAHQIAPDRQHRFRDRRPCDARGMARFVPIAAPVRVPAVFPGRGHRHRHLLSEPRLGRKERRRRGHAADVGHHRRLRLGPQIALQHLHAPDRQSRLHRLPFRHRAPAVAENHQFAAFARPVPLAGPQTPTYIRPEAWRTGHEGPHKAQGSGCRITSGADAVTGPSPSIA